MYGSENLACSKEIGHIGRKVRGIIRLIGNARRTAEVKGVKRLPSRVARLRQGPMQMPLCIFEAATE